MIEFIEEGHIYLMDGVIVSSVSEILCFIFPNKYVGIDKEILNKKAEYGSKIHEAIECIEQGKMLPKLDSIQEFSISQYKRLKDKHKIEVIDQEQMINFKDKYCGRFDMIANVNGFYSLCDIKTTATLDKEYLSWQLSFYELAFISMYGVSNFDKLYAIWLPKKGYGEVVEIKRKSKSELLEKLNEFEKVRSNEYGK